MGSRSDDRDAVGYLRCSTDQQDDSIRQQKIEVTEYAEVNNYNLLGFYEDEGYSGTVFEKRPAFMKMVSDAEKVGGFRFILVFDETRWGRALELDESLGWKWRFKKLGVKVIIINTQSGNTNDFKGVIVTSMEAASASETSVRDSEATRRGQAANAREGYSTGGVPPFGYRRIAVNKSTGVFIRELPAGVWSNDDEGVLLDLGPEHQLEVVRSIFKHRKQGLGYTAIANLLNQLGIPCPQTGRWKNKDSKWSSSTIRSILVNPVYYGCRVYARHPQSHLSGSSKGVWMNDKDKWVVKENAHPAIISKKLFDEVNNSIQPYKRSNRFFYQSPYLLTGLVLCENCSFNFNGQTRKLVSKKTGRSYTISYYLCSGYSSKGISVCHSFLLRKDKLEGAVIKIIKKYIRDKNFLQKIQKIIEEKLLNNSEFENLLNNLSEEIASNKSVLKNLLSLITNGANLQEVKSEVLRVTRQIEYLERTFNDIQSKEITKNHVDNLVGKIKKLADNFEKTLRKAPLHIQKNLIRQFVKKIIVDPHTGDIEIILRRVPWMDNEIAQKDIFGTESVKFNFHSERRPS